ncbi:acyl-CoA dehydrogenase family protein [Amycolatopsis silviterrae]|uniref:Acyl-CoA dehydrogenase family protein n=1 Tax=Amycolatopsis silviterrae TaxID=1656914 RepID=A0ABW5HBG4_9PSEU
MDFDLNDDLDAVRELAAKIFADRATVNRVVAVEKQGGFDADLWRVLAEADLLGICLSEKDGGAGVGVTGMAVLLEELGRQVAPVPLWNVLAGGVLPVAQFGSEDQRNRILPRVLDGSTLLVGAFDDTVSVTATRRGDDLELTGEVVSVPAGAQADLVLVPVKEADQVHLVLVPTVHLSVTPVQVTSRESHASIVFTGAVVTPQDILASGADALQWTLRRLRVALAAVSVGVCAQALSTTAKYTSERVQFGRPLSTNQAVALRAADAYLDTEAIRVCTQRAAWLMDEGREDEAEIAAVVAKWWASRGGLRVVHATQHLHGGIGADVDYPIHRYFLWGRQLAFTLGTADALAAELGDRLPSAPPIGAPA